jgi:predicted nucleic acid-binding Zn ribbon protein
MRSKAMVAFLKWKDKNMPYFSFPCDPECPEYAKYVDALTGDPMTHAMGAPVDEIMEDFERSHKAKCERCVAYAVANVDVR